MKPTSDNKRARGQFFTRYNPFDCDGFLRWADDCQLTRREILEPFAGQNHLIAMLRNMGLCRAAASYDIEPMTSEVQARDTLADFPRGFDVCVTNPPYLARNSARRRGLHYPPNPYDDLYKFALRACLTHCESVAAIIPASFLNAELFRARLSRYILLNSKMFRDTDHPVCLALFTRASDDVAIYEGKLYRGMLSDFAQKIPRPTRNAPMRFNDRNGNLGLRAVDNTTDASIRFCRGEDIDPARVNVGSRSVTRIAIDGCAAALSKKLNDALGDFRRDTRDLFLTPFKGLRKDNQYRRRLDYATAKILINSVV